MGVCAVSSVDVVVGLPIYYCQNRCSPHRLPIFFSQAKKKTPPYDKIGLLGEIHTARQAYARTDYKLICGVLGAFCDTSY